MSREEGRAVQHQGEENYGRRVGKVLSDKWRLDQLLGVGGMAAVYAATHRNGNRVAIKVLHAHCAADEGIRSRFQREGYVANMIEHPGAVRVLDDGIADDLVFLVMELLEGETLEARLRRGGRLRAREALTIADGLLDVLAAAHVKGIVHRDVKLDNVFLSSAGQVKVLDFGIARLAETPELQRFGRTRTGSVMGTPAFMAPEQALARSSEIDGQTDVWAVGATLFKALTGRYVHEATTMNEQLVQAATRPAPPLTTVLPEVPSNLAAVVDRALAFHKGERWPSARAMQDAVRAVVQATQPTPTDVSVPTPMPRVQVTSTFEPPAARFPTGGAAPSVAPAPARRWGLVVAAVGAVVVSLGVAAWTFWRTREAVERRDQRAPAVELRPAQEGGSRAASPVTRPEPANEAAPVRPAISAPRPEARAAARSHLKAAAGAKRSAHASGDEDDDLFARRH